MATTKCIPVPAVTSPMTQIATIPVRLWIAALLFGRPNRYTPNLADAITAVQSVTRHEFLCWLVFQKQVKALAPSPRNYNQNCFLPVKKVSIS